MNTTYLNKIKAIYSQFCDFEKEKIPLCAAETFISKFVKQAMGSDFEGKYIQGYKKRVIEKDNIGSDKIYPLLCLVEEICCDMFSANYVDSRTLSGMNCLAILIMAIVDKSSTVVITTKEMGGQSV